MNKFAIIFSIFLIVLATSYAKEYLGMRPDQSIGVRGILKCNNRPAANVLVKLYDHDSEFMYIGIRYDRIGKNIKLPNFRL
jgi:hypothetical protein